MGRHTNVVVSYQSNDRAPLLTPEQASALLRRCRVMLICWALLILLADAMGLLINDLIISGVAGLLALAVLAVALAAWGGWMGERRKWRQLAAVLACLIVVASLMCTNWAMRASFKLSEPALNQLADDVAAGKSIEFPKRAGAFFVFRTDVNPIGGATEVCLWTTPLRGSHLGFVRSCVDVTPPYNPWTHWQLSDRWHHFSVD